jgi:hypothetical protein
MLTRTQVIISTTGNIKDIQPYCHNNGKDFFIVGDDHGNTVSIEPIVSMIGIEVVANAKGINLTDYVNSLVEEINQWKKDVAAETPKEEPKPVEEPKIIQPEEKKEEPNATSNS